MRLHAATRSAMRVLAISFALLSAQVSCIGPTYSSPVHSLELGAPWVAPGQQATATRIIRHYPWTDGRDIWIEWSLGAHGTLNSDDLSSKVTRCLEEIGDWRPSCGADVRVDPLWIRSEPLQYGRTSEFGMILDHGWVVVALEPLVLVSCNHDIADTDADHWPASWEQDYALTPLIVSLGNGVLVGARVPMAEPAFWCSPDLGILPRRVVPNAHGEWHIQLPWGVLHFVPRNGFWESAPAVDGSVASSPDAARTLALTGSLLSPNPPVPVVDAARSDGETADPCAPIHQPPPELVGSWAGTLGDLHVWLSLTRDGSGHCAYTFGRFPGPRHFTAQFVALDRQSDGTTFSVRVSDTAVQAEGSWRGERVGDKIRLNMRTPFHFDDGPAPIVTLSPVDPSHFPDWWRNDVPSNSDGR